MSRADLQVVRRFAVLMIVLFMAFTLTAGIALDHASAKKEVRVTIDIRTKDQAALLTTQRLNLKIRATAPTSVRVKIRAGGSSDGFATRRIRFSRSGSKRVFVFLNRAGREKLSTCGPKSVEVISRFSKHKRGKKTERATTRKRLVASSKQCPIVPPPIATDDNPLTDEETSRYVEVLANDLDPSGTSLSIVSVDDSGATGSTSVAGNRVKYDPDGGFEALVEGQTGSDSFTYTIEDGKGERDSATVTVEIEGVEDPSKVSATPALYPEYSPGTSDYVTRCDGSPVQIDVDAGPGNSIDVDGQGSDDGDFSTEVELAANQKFSFVRDAGASQTTHHVRCLPADFPEWTFEKFSAARQQWYLVTRELYNVIFDGNGGRSGGSATPHHGEI